MRILNTHYEDVPPENSLTPEEIEQICCERMPVDECSEVGRVSDYNGASQDDIDQDAALEQARADNPGKRILGVRIEDVGRPGKPCGKMRETWQGHLNCCDFVEPMAWDDSISVEVLVPGTRGIVGVTGGAPPYHWSVRGEGFTLDGYNLRDGWTNTPYVWIYAGPFACGWAPIEVTDGCSIVRDGVRSTVGEWRRVGSPFRPIDIYKPDQHGMFTKEINGYQSTIAGTWFKGKYCLNSESPDISPAETWYYKTWVVYNNGSESGHWQSCFDAAGEAILDPFAGVFSIPVVGNSQFLETSDSTPCGGYFFRNWWLETELSVWEWVC